MPVRQDQRTYARERRRLRRAKRFGLRFPPLLPLEREPNIHVDWRGLLLGGGNQIYVAPKLREGAHSLRSCWVIVCSCALQSGQSLGSLALRRMFKGKLVAAFFYLLLWSHPLVDWIRGYLVNVTLDVYMQSLVKPRRQEASVSEHGPRVTPNVFIKPILGHWIQHLESLSQRVSKQRLLSIKGFITNIVLHCIAVIK